MWRCWSVRCTVNSYVVNFVYLQAERSTWYKAWICHGYGMVESWCTPATARGVELCDHYRLYGATLISLGCWSLFSVSGSCLMKVFWICQKSFFHNSNELNIPHFSHHDQLLLSDYIRNNGICSKPHNQTTRGYVNEQASSPTKIYTSGHALTARCAEVSGL